MLAGRVVVGGALIVVGGLFLLATATDLDAGGLVSRWWPLLFVFLGLVQVTIDRRAAMGSVMLAAVGLLLLAFTTGLVEGSVWSVLWPTIVLLAGVALVVPRRRSLPEAAGDTVRGFAAFGPRRIVSRSRRLRGGELTAVLGSIELDLTEAMPTVDARLAVTALLGGCEIVVPHGWDVRLSGVPILGAWDDTTQRNGVGPDAPVLRISAFVMLGGVEVRHPSRWK